MACYSRNPGPRNRTVTVWVLSICLVYGFNQPFTYQLFAGATLIVGVSEVTLEIIFRRCCRNAMSEMDLVWMRLAYCPRFGRLLWFGPALASAIFSPPAAYQSLSADGEWGWIGLYAILPVTALGWGWLLWPLRRLFVVTS